MVHDNILEDLVFPSEIVGKRIHIKLDGSRNIKVHLDVSQKTQIEHKVRPTLSLFILFIYHLSCFGRVAPRLAIYFIYLLFVSF